VSNMELLPCPHCGGKAKMTGDEMESGYSASVYIYCDECHARGPIIDFPAFYNCGGMGSKWRISYESAATMAWNKRTTIDHRATPDSAADGRKA
jgi:DnaJ-class molecular chaperone